MTETRSEFHGRGGERGVALITGILLLFLASSLLAGFLAAVVSDSKLRHVDRSRTEAFYAAHAGLEKLTADLGNLFMTDFSPDVQALAALEKEPPVINTCPTFPSPCFVQFVAGDGLGYNVDWVDENGDGEPDVEDRFIPTGPFQGFRGQITTYDLWVTARIQDGAEARVKRQMNTVSIPVFQFGIFSETDLTFSANEQFSFGGRVHTNGNLFLAAASGGTTTLAEKVTAVKEVVRKHLANTRPVGGTHQGTVRMAKAPGSYRNLAEAEGSADNAGAAPNEPTWTNISVGTYNGYIRNGRTGAEVLTLPLTSLGAKPIDLIKRPVVGEDPLIRGQRLFSQASIRILLSDLSSDITDLDGVSNTPPVALVGVPAGVANAAPFAASDLRASNQNYGHRAPAGTALIDGFLKVEYKDAAGTWIDVTTEWLSLGYTRRNWDENCPNEPASVPGTGGANQILRLQRVRSSLGALPDISANVPCGHAGATGALTNNATDYWPLVLYDIREGYNRDTLATNSSTMFLAGVMHHVELDINNLRRWLSGAVAGSGPLVDNPGGDGYVVYFSDRRNARNPTGNSQLDGEWGWEDFVNPSDVNGTPNGSLNNGEDVNEDGALQTHGATAVPPSAGAGALWVGWERWANGGAVMSASTPRTQLTTSCYGGGSCANDTPANKARTNRAILFRRALKLANGALGNLPTDGLTIVAENPVYVQGNYNANAAGFAGGSAPAAIMADAITLLSNGWNDSNSFVNPNNPANRRAQQTWYRFAALSGKGRNWPQTNTPASFGTDGGVHNFLRLIEDWNNVTLNYRGSLASFFYSRQAVGLFRCCSNVYELPGRAFAFDTNFLTPSLLPPKTPMFRDVNTTAFTLVTSRQQ